MTDAEGDIEIEKIMKEKNCDRKLAHELMEDRKEREFVKQQHSKPPTKETFDNAINQEKEAINNSKLEDVYSTIEKWLGIRPKDRRRIDVVLATALSNKESGIPLWLFLIGNSGDWKTTLVKSLEGLTTPNVVKIDQLTENTLASGKMGVDDLGSELQNSSTVLLIPDCASITSMNKDKKNAIWGQFRTLYDGYICKKTGNGIDKRYENCYTTLIACSTEALREEILLNSQLGTRELLYDTDADAVDNNLKMDKAINNDKYEQQMAEEIRTVVHNFILYHKIKDSNPNEEMLNFLKSEAQRLTILRAVGMIDYTRSECIAPIYPEVPTRVIKQFVRLYRCLKSLDDNYPDEHVKEIITHIVNSSGNKVRQMVLGVMEHNIDGEFKIQEIQHKTKLGRNSVKTQLEILWNLGVIEKETREERIGGYVTSYEGHEDIRGGHIEEVSYYTLRRLSMILPSAGGGSNICLSDRMKSNRSPLELDDFMGEHLQEIVDLVEKNHDCMDEDALCSEIKQEIFSQSPDISDEKLHQLVKDSVKFVSEMIEDANGEPLTEGQLTVFKGIVKFYKSASKSIVIKTLISKGGVKDEAEAETVIETAVRQGLVRRIKDNTALEWVSS